MLSRATQAASTRTGLSLSVASISKMMAGGRGGDFMLPLLNWKGAYRRSHEAHYRKRISKGPSCDRQIGCSIN